MSTSPAAPLGSERPRRTHVRPARPRVAPVAAVPVPPRKKGLWERVDPLWVVLGLAFVSLSIHVGVAYGAQILVLLNKAAAAISQTIQVAVIEKPKPPPEPEKPPPPEPPKPKPVKRIVKLDKLPPPPP